MLVFGLLHRIVNTIKKIHAKRVCVIASSCFFTQLVGAFRRLIAYMYLDSAGRSISCQDVSARLGARIKLRLFPYVKQQAQQIGAVVFSWYVMVSRFAVINGVDSRGIRIGTAGLGSVELR